MTSQEKTAAIFAIFDTLIAKGEFNWDDVVERVKAAKVAPKNWMSIRGILQYHIYNKIIERVPDIHREKYRRI